jgi:ectoine hydroxylase-related dioxygenase (phytanoyl-CoA dioxygenase family)
MAASGYLTVEPDRSVKPVSDLGWTPDLVDYENHGAYRDLIERAPLALRLEALTIFAVSMAKLLVKRVIKYEFIPYDTRADKSFGGRLRFAGAALKNMVRGDARARRLAAAGGEAGNMGEHGIHVVTMPVDRFAVLDEAARVEFDRLAARRGQSNGRRQFEESRGQASRAEQRELFDVIETTLKEAGVFDVASAYLGRKARLIDVNPQINDTSDTFWRDIFPDTELKSLPPTAYCHRDASGGDLKAIIYMTDVDDRTGPFSYVVGSNRMKLDRLDDLICEANDSNGLAGTDARSRARFAALPARLRQKGSFGNDVRPETPLGREIGQGLWAVKAGKGSIVLFDTKGIHRGGMVEAGERRVITCVVG